MDVDSTKRRGDAGGGDSWFRELDADTRDALTALYRLDRRRNLMVLVFLGIWAAAYGAMLIWPVWPLRLAGYVVIGAVLHAFGVLLHEAVHGNFFRDHDWDRRVGFLLGIPLFLSAEAYRVTHLVHHRHTREPEDPDDLDARVRDRDLRSVAFYVLGLIGLLVFLVHVPYEAVRHGDRRERLRIAGEYAVLVLLYVVVVTAATQAGALPHLLHAWLLPGLVTLLIVNVRGWAEHLMTRRGNPLTESRTVTSNAVVRFFLCNVNYHLEHHLLPAVPWYNLPRMHEALRPVYRRAGAHTYRSYLRFLWDALRAGVHGVLPDRPSSGPAEGRWTAG